MSELPAAQHNRLQAWATRANAKGWLADEALHTLDSASGANPGQLFDETARPLVAGLFGGTGVGKSTLLNRLAGQRVARASAERPTSRDITVYVHRSISVDRLPDEFPMQRMRTALHNNDTYRHIMFIDMPDFDSVEQSNRELVDQWMPHLDLVMYVVSPERYRDDMGWKLLQRHASEHAWLFIINQWDRGNEAQRSDFIDTLAARGMSKPVVFCTDCAHPNHAPDSHPDLATDDFSQLQQTLVNLSDQQIIIALQKYGVLARLQQLKTQADPWLDALGEPQSLEKLPTHWGEALEKQQVALHDAVSLPIQQGAQRYVDDTPFWRRLFGLHASSTPLETSTIQRSTQTLSLTLTDRLDTLKTHFINQQAHTSGLPFNALSQALDNSADLLKEQSEHKLQNALSAALLHPGKLWHRRLYQWVGKLCLLLPLASLGWISYRIVSGFAAGSSDPGAYLNSSFAVNGSLLIGVSWLLPALAHTYLKPSTEEAARQGLRTGVDDVLDDFDATTRDALKQLSLDASELRADYQTLWNEWPDDLAADMPDSVQRMLSDKLFSENKHDGALNGLPQEETPLRVLDVRANTQSSTDAAPLS